MSWLAITPALGLALTLSLVACGRDPKPVMAVPAQIPAPAGAVTTAGAGPNPSVPDASGTFAAQDSAERAKALQDQGALNKSGPPSTMSKEQESKAMPLPGQANDHSTAVRDDKRKATPAN